MEEIKDNPLEVEANSVRDSIKRNGALVYKNVIKLDVINDFMEDFVYHSEPLNFLAGLKPQEVYGAASPDSGKKVVFCTGNS